MAFLVNVKKQKQKQSKTTLNSIWHLLIYLPFLIGGVTITKWKILSATYHN